MDKRYISVTDTAVLIRAALKGAFPGVKFSVRSKSYSGGASIDVRWFDGPTSAEVERVAKEFQGATFDGMRDCKEYHTSTLNGERVHYGADFVFCTREYSKGFIERAIEMLRNRGHEVADAVVDTWSSTGAAHVKTSDYEVQNLVHRFIQFLRPNGIVVRLK